MAAPSPRTKPLLSLEKGLQEAARFSESSLASTPSDSQHLNEPYVSRLSVPPARTKSTKPYLIWRNASPIETEEDEDGIPGYSIGKPYNVECKGDVCYLTCNQAYKRSGSMIPNNGNNG